MVRLTLSRPLSLVKTPTLENLQEISDNVSSPQKPKRKTLTQPYIPQPVGNGANKVPILQVPRVQSPPKDFPKEQASLYEHSFLPKFLLLTTSISQVIRHWIQGEKVNLKIHNDKHNNPVEWGYFVDLESVAKHHYLRNKFNQKHPKYEQPPLFMLIPNPWTLDPIKEKNSNLDSEPDSFTDNNSLEKWYDTGLLYAIISFVSLNRKNRLTSTKTILGTLGVLTFSIGFYSIYMLNTIHYGLHKQVAE